MDITITVDDFERLPELFGAWDLGMLLEAERSYLVENAGRTDDGQTLFMVFCRPSPSVRRCNNDRV